MSNDYNGKKRSELPDSVFGIPQERKYPIPDEKHTRSAIKLFNHVDPKYEEQLAKAIIKNMKKYNIDGSVVGPNNRLRKYLPKDMIKESSILEGYLKSDKDIYYNAKVPKSTKLYHASPSQNLKIIYPNNKSLDPNICNDAVFASSDRRYAACFGTIWSNDHARMGSFDGWRTVVFATDGTIDLDSPCSLYELYNDGSFININKNEMVSYKEARVKTEHKYKSFKSMLIDLKIEIVSMKDYISMMKGSYIEEGYFKSIGESSVNENEENSILPILELQKRLSKFKYGVPINGKIKNASKVDFGKEYKTLASKEFEKYEAGVCWDFANYQEIELAKIYGRSSVQNYYFIVDKEPNYPTHTITVVKVGSYFYYPEASWGKMMGVYRDKSISHILNTVAKKLADEAGSAEYVECRKYSSYDRLTKLSPIEYMNKMNTMTKVQVSLKESKLQKVTKDNINESVSILPQDTGISTVIFDLGDVLVSANIRDYLKKDPEVPNEIVDELLKLWFIDKDEVDDTMDLDTYREIVNKRMGVEFSKYIPKLFQYNVDCVTAFDYTIPMIQDLKDKGYKVYYLSNWSAWTYDLLQEAGKFDFLKLMDGGVFSYDAGYMKPDEEIYKILLNKYKINPEETLFFDDREENIEVANKLGIHGVHFPRHDSSIVYNTLANNAGNYEYTTEKFIMSKNLDEQKVAKEILNTIKPIIMTPQNKAKASKLGLTLKCEIEEVDSGMIFILVFDGSQDKRDNDEAKTILKDLASKCKSKLSDIVSKVDIGDGDEGCLYFTIDKTKIKRKRKDLLQESVEIKDKIGEHEIEDIKTIISSLQDGSFDDFKFKDIVYCDIRYKSKKPIAFITIRVKSVNNYTVGYVSLAVNPKYQNQGIEKSLATKAVSWFKKEKGIHFLEWHCLQDNEASKKLASSAGFREYIAKNSDEYIRYTMESSIQEYGTTGGTIVRANQPLYFYHMVDSGANLSKGLLSLEYMYHHSKSLFLKNASKYRDRLCNGWDIYPGRNPKSLTAEEIYEGIKKFRNEDNLNTIYFFRYPPYSSLDKRFDRLYKYKKLYRININDPKVKSIIKNINYGWIDSNTGNDPLDRKYYETISPEDYFNNFDPDKGLLFSTLYHISIEVKNGYIPMKLLEEVKIPNTIEDIISIEESSIQEYGTTGGTIVGSNQPDSVYIVNYMQNNVFSGYKEPKRAICKKGMNQMYTTNSGKAIPVDIDKFKEEASDISIFKFKGTPVLSYDQIIENASTDNDFYLLLTGDSPKAYGDLEYDNRFIQEENFFDELSDITFCTESTITGQIESSNYPYMKILTESMDGRCWNFYRDINGVFAMNELTGLRTPSYENIEDIPKSQIQLIERGTVYFGN